MSRFTQDAIVNRTTRWMVGGPLSGPEWERIQAFPVGFVPQFTIFNGHLYMSPSPTSGQSVYFDYMTGYWALSGGTVAKPTFTADTDTCLLDDELMALGLKWRMLRLLGQPYEEAKVEYNNAVFAMLAQDAGGKRTIDAGGPGKFSIPSAMVPEGSWNIT